MSEPERDAELARRYGSLPREEPSAEMDAAILAAARRAAETRPAPLVVPTARRRWYFPLAAAAVIVLAVAVTVQLERQQPDPESAVPPVPPVPEKYSPAPELQRKELARKPLQQPEAKPPASREVAPKPPGPPAEIAKNSAEDRAGAAAAPAAPAARADARARTLAKMESPEQALERIAELRRAGRHEEADEALREFRKRYPDFKISEEMLKRVEK
jgi:hypothetical protein